MIIINILTIKNIINTIVSAELDLIYSVSDIIRGIANKRSGDKIITKFIILNI